MNHWDEDSGDSLEAAEDWPTYFTQVPVWISACEALSAQGLRMYIFLAEHINVAQPGQRIACPSRKAIAKFLGLKDYRDVKRYDEELNAIGAVRTTEHRYQGGMRRAYRYRVRFNPPEGFAGIRSLKDFYEANPQVRAKTARGKTATALDPATPDTPVHVSGETAGQGGGGENPTSGGGILPTAPGGRVPTSRGGDSPTAERDQPQRHPSDGDERHEKREPLRGSEREARRSEGSVGPVETVENGADDHTAPKPGRAPAAAPRPAAARRKDTQAGVRLAKADLQTVMGYLPHPVASRLPKRLPPVLTRALAGQVALVGAKRVGERAAMRWMDWGFDAQHDAGEIVSYVGVAVALVNRGECKDDFCDDGTIVDTGRRCGQCEVRSQDAKAAHRRSREQDGEHGPDGQEGPASAAQGPAKAPGGRKAPGSSPVPGQRRQQAPKAPVRPMLTCPECDRAFRAPAGSVEGRVRCGECRETVPAG